MPLCYGHVSAASPGKTTAAYGWMGIRDAVAAQIPPPHARTTRRSMKQASLSAELAKAAAQGMAAAVRVRIPRPMASFRLHRHVDGRWWLISCDTGELLGALRPECLRALPRLARALDGASESLSLAGRALRPGEEPEICDLLDAVGEDGWKVRDAGVGAQALPLIRGRRCRRCSLAARRRMPLK